MLDNWYGISDDWTHQSDPTMEIRKKTAIPEDHMLNPATLFDPVTIPSGTSGSVHASSTTMAGSQPAVRREQARHGARDSGRALHPK
jgi:hypothetical protein